MNYVFLNLKVNALCRLWLETPNCLFFFQVKQLLWLLNICLDFPVLKIVIDLLCHLLLIGVVGREISFKKKIQGGWAIKEIWMKISLKIYFLSGIFME